MSDHPTTPPAVDGIRSRVDTFVGRVTYQGVERYTDSGDIRTTIDLSDNTNLWGVPPNASRALVDGVEGAARYPTAYAPGLVEALATYAGVSGNMVVTGCGSDDVLDATMRALGEPGTPVGLPDPSFPMAAVFARTNGLVPRSVPLARDGHIDVDALLATAAPILYVASPANPTGIATTVSALESLIARAPGVVIIDAAYAEFAVGSAAMLCRFVHQSDRVIVVRTMSKAWGLAGLRIGYAVAAARLIAEIEKARGPFKVNRLAEQAAVVALRADRDWVEARVQEVIANRERLMALLLAAGLRPMSSEANFILIPVREMGIGATALAAYLRAQGVGVRAFPALRGIGEAIRVTIGPWMVMQRLLEAVATVYAPVQECL